MKSLVFGSLNLDITMQLDHIVAPGETIAAKDMQVFTGGKGFNQAIALARAGSNVAFAGAIGDDGEMLMDAMKEANIDTTHVLRLPCKTGQAIIQVDSNGQNCIIILAGANGQISKEHVDSTLADYARGDLILLQNEIANMPYIVESAHRLGMQVALNPSPYREDLMALIPQVDILLLNEVEGEQLTGEQDPQKIMDALQARYPGISAVVTLGADGAWFLSAEGERTFGPAFRCKAVDTTAAGDTFTGFFLTTYLASGDAALALRTAAQASAIAVSRPGAAPSIPTMAEVQAALA